MRKQVTVFFLLFLAIGAFAQAPEIGIEITPDHSNWNYALGEEARFKVTVTKDKTLLKDQSVRYSFGYEKMKAYETGEVVLKKGETEIATVGMTKAGVLTCRVFVDYEGKKYENYVQVAYQPEEILPMTHLPVDFEHYWEDAKKENEKIALNPVMTRAEEFCSDKIDCYYIRVDNYRKGTYLYGCLAIPKGEGPFPSVVNYPGAGVAKMAPNRQLAEEGVITLQIGIHGIPHTMEKEVYEDLKNGALFGYQYSSLDVRDDYYYKRVFMGCIRAIDFIYTLPQFDGERLAVSGGSQGGALTLVTTALDKRVKYYVCFYPAMCDHVAYLYEQAGGWPHLFAEHHSRFRTPERIVNSNYYDAANFARLITVPGFFGWGYNDPTCPVTSMYAAYNVVPGEKELLLELKNKHTRSRRQMDESNKWILQKLGVK